jgi:hypothetical protein
LGPCTAPVTAEREGDQPKTFEHPLLSLRADFLMAYQTLTGKVA